MPYAFLHTMLRRGLLGLLPVVVLALGAAPAHAQEETEGRPLSYELAPQLWFNRVDALHAGLEGALDVGTTLTLRANGGYKTGLERLSYGGGASLWLGDTEVALKYQYGVDRRYTSHVYGRLFNGAQMLMAAGQDYFDYLGVERVRLGVTHEVVAGLATVEVRLNNERHRSVPRTTSYDLFGHDFVQPPNPPVDNPGGWLRSVSGTVTAGGGGAPWGVAGRRFLRLGAEYSSPDVASSDFDFARFWGEAEYSLATLFQERAYPNTLEVRLVGGTATGTLPVQRYGAVGASIRPLTPFGVLKTLGDRPYVGEHYAAVHWEHDFRGVLLESVGLVGLSRRGWGFIVHGGHGRTWVSDDARDRLGTGGALFRTPDGVHHELGLSLNGILGLLRLDVTARLDEPGVFFGVSAARLF